MLSPRELIFGFWGYRKSGCSGSSSGSAGSALPEAFFAIGLATPFAAPLLPGAGVFAQPAQFPARADLPAVTASIGVAGLPCAGRLAQRWGLSWRGGLARCGRFPDCEVSAHFVQTLAADATNG
jgi:hypothetical protein